MKISNSFLFLSTTSFFYTQAQAASLRGSSPQPNAPVNTDSFTADRSLAAHRQAQEPSTNSSSSGAKYWFNMTEAITDTFSGGVAYFMDPTAVSDTTMSLAVLDLNPGGVRELHWHPNAAEWGFVTQGTCRVTLMNNNGQYDNLEVGVGGIWNFPESWGHAIQGVDPEVGCKMVLFFNSPEIPTYNDLGITEVMAYLPKDVLSENIDTSEDTIATFPKSAPVVVTQGPMPPPPLVKSTNPLPESPIINILDGTCKDAGAGGYIYEVRNDVFPGTKSMSGGLIRQQKGSVRDIHWHPNADEMHYVLSGSLKVTVYGIGGQQDTYTLKKGDVGFVPKGFVHYLEAMEDTEILLAFNNPNWQTQELSSWLAVTPSYLTAASLDTTTEVVEGFPQSTAYFFGDSFDGCPDAPTLPECYGC